MIAVKGVANGILKGGIYRVLTDNWELVVQVRMYIELQSRLKDDTSKRIMLPGLKVGHTC